MKITLLTVGKIKAGWLSEGIDQYLNWLGRYAQVEVIEVADEAEQLPLAVLRKKEGERLCKHWPDKGQIIALDLGGKQMDSETFSRQVQHWLEIGMSELTFIIAGSSGFDPTVLQRCTGRLCLSPMTFTHQMTRLILAEQLYRAFKIHFKEPYHK